MIEGPGFSRVLRMNYGLELGSGIPRSGPKYRQNVHNGLGLYRDDLSKRNLAYCNLQLGRQGARHAGGATSRPSKINPLLQLHLSATPCQNSISISRPKLSGSPARLCTTTMGVSGCTSTEGQGQACRVSQLPTLEPIPFHDAW